VEDLFAEQLKALRAASLDRHLREISSSQGPEIEIDGRRLVNFSSNDYLGFANDSRLRKAANVSDHVDVQMGTLSKALGASGGYICGSRNLIEWLINRARSFVYSTAPLPTVAATALPAVNFLSSSEGEKRRLLLWERIYLMRKFLLALSRKRSTLNSQLKLRQRDFPLDRGRRTSGAQPRVCAAKRRIPRSSDSLSHRGQRRRAVAHYRDGIAPGRSDPFALRSDQTTKRGRVIL